MRQSASAGVIDFKVPAQNPTSSIISRRVKQSDKNTVFIINHHSLHHRVPHDKTHMVPIQDESRAFSRRKEMHIICCHNAIIVDDEDVVVAMTEATAATEAAPTWLEQEHQQWQGQHYLCALKKS